MAFLSKRVGINFLRSIQNNIGSSKCLSFSVIRTNQFKDELTARQMANDNPFDSYVLKPEPGRGLFKNDPILVPSMKKAR